MKDLLSALDFVYIIREGTHPKGGLDSCQCQYLHDMRISGDDGLWLCFSLLIQMFLVLENNEKGLENILSSSGLNFLGESNQY